MQSDAKTSAKFPPEFQPEAGQTSGFRASLMDAETEIPASRKTMSQDFEYVVRLRPLLTGWRIPAQQRLRAALKVLLRGFGLRCVDCKPISSNDARTKAQP